MSHVFAINYANACDIVKNGLYGVLFMKNNMNYFLLFFLMGISCGSVFGVGLSVALKTIVFFPIGISVGMIFGAIIGLAVKKSKDNSKK